MRSSWSSSVEVDGAQDGSWRHHCFARLYLAANPSHVGDNVDGLACLLHHPMVHDRQTRRQGFLSGPVLSHRTAVVSGTFSGGVKAPGLEI
jgi:hypothetical protein